MILLTGLLRLGLQQEWWEGGSATNLTAREYDKTIHGPGLKVVKFFTSWCKFCRYMKEDYERLVAEESTGRVHYFNVNCEQEMDLCNRKGIVVFPHILLYGFKGGQIYSYTGYLTYDEMSSAIRTAYASETGMEKAEEEIRDRQKMEEAMRQYVEQERLVAEQVEQRLAEAGEQQVKLEFERTLLRLDVLNREVRELELSLKTLKSLATGQPELARRRKELQTNMANLTRTQYEQRERDVQFQSASRVYLGAGAILSAGIVLLYSREEEEERGLPV